MTAGDEIDRTGGLTALPGAPAARALPPICQSDPIFSARYDLSTWQGLGSGAFAAVGRVFCPLWAQHVAVKIFWHLTPEARVRLTAEAKNTNRIQSPYVVKVQAPLASEQLLWIEMEYVEGRNLEDELTAAPPGTDRALDLGLAISEAVAAAHLAGVAHRDVKPANILVPASGQPLIKLGDFGLSKWSETSRLTQTGGFGGTPKWAPPEAFKGQPVGPAGDIYSLGLVLFALFSGNKFPYELGSDSAIAAMAVHSQQKPQRLRSVKPDLPRALDELVTRMLSKNERQRPRAAEVVEALRQLKGGAVHTPAPAARGRAAALAGVVGAILVVGALVARRYQAPELLPFSSPPPPVMLPVASAAPGVSPSPAAEPAPSPGPPEASLTTAGTPTPPPSATHPRPPFAVTLDDAFVTIRNTSKDDVADLRVTLVGDAGNQYSVLAPGVLAPGEDLSLPLTIFEPEPPPGLRPVRALVSGSAPAGRREVSLRIR